MSTEGRLFAGPMRVCVAGSRDIAHPEQAYEVIRYALQDHIGLENIRWVNHGGQRGVDQIGRQVAIDLDLRHVGWYADWKHYGLAAGPLRNERMLTHSDYLVLVWDGQSPGSANAKSIAQRKGIPIREVILVK